MKQRVWQVLILFIVFYFLIRLIQDMPNVVNGHLQLLRLPDHTGGIMQKTLHILMFSISPVLTYLFLLKFYSTQPVATGALVGVVAVAIFFALFLIEGNGSRLRYYFLNNLFYFIIYTLFGILFFFIQFTAFKELQRKELLMQHRQSELSFLRSQLNPHFLFNSLNNIYSLVNQKSDKALDAIAGFSQLMRYMLYDASEFIKLSEEVNYIHKYINLQQLRFEDLLPVTVSVSGDPEAFLVSPLLLIPFVENAFKHGSFAGPGGELILSISASSTNLEFYCSNKINRMQKDAGTGIGLENVRRRLELLHPAKHHLSAGAEHDRFVVKLQIKYE